MGVESCPDHRLGSPSGRLLGFGMDLVSSNECVSSLSSEKVHVALVVVAAEELNAEPDSIGAPLWEALMVPPRRPSVALLKEVQGQPKQAAASLEETSEQSGPSEQQPSSFEPTGRAG